MSDDVDTIRHALKSLKRAQRVFFSTSNLADDALAALGRVVAERDALVEDLAQLLAEREELRARLQRSDAEVSSLRVAWTYAHISSPDAQEQDPGGASGASSTAAPFRTLAPGDSA